MEAVSKKRGRPKALSDYEMACAAESSGKTVRSRQNFAYATRAHWRLKSDDPNASPYAHFLPSFNEVMSGEKTYSLTLLSEIGRLPFDMMATAAQEICDRKLSTREAIKFVRRVRLGNRRKPFSQLELVQKIAKSIDAYQETHEATFDQLLIALQSVAEIISEMQRESDQ